ncbi:lipopolysaccharide chain length determinant protein [Pseudescherichia vulneris NBRC 102420]|uniref:Chain length determinant protein n=1 Tax=Pseudescherichia vulneris NBRC 102420 TaxID=1115515 RepID=A0A090V0C1_PSEVU|nr:LPS O-antigen chain length determinant protein WzzB [Pseudescherichia vulneris]GAL57513.1 lipopolysaccharide chain length determinant protein [Pseudescherichia vulneris NBRC 102420]STQ60598.1 regulator of length of O-antigen component of lipopolysaccharide chains [Pseudescherichia vulneris]
MTQNHNNGSSRNEDLEQIDFIDLVLQLWREKWVIAVCMVLTLAIAAVLLTVTEEKWTSTAVITMPDAGQITGYTSAMSVLSGTDINDIQQRVIGRFSAAFSALSETLENQVNPEKLTIDPAVKGQALPLKVTYQGDSADNAQKTLAQYIQQVDEQIADELNQDLTVNMKSRTDELVALLSTQEKVAQEQKELRLKQISQALKVAQESQIKTPQVQQIQDVSQDAMFLLGSEALESMVKNESMRPLVFPESYYQMRKNLLDIARLKPDPANMHSYRYVMKPNLPVRRDSPKRALTLILAILLGGILGSGYVLTRNALRNYQPKA